MVPTWPLRAEAILQPSSQNGCHLLLRIQFSGSYVLDFHTSAFQRVDKLWAPKLWEITLTLTIFEISFHTNVVEIGQ